MSVTILVGDVRERLEEVPSESIQCCVTSPPYWGLRDYGHDGQIGLEQTPEAYVDEMVDVFREVRRVLRNDGTLWLNLGDSYASFRDGKATPDSTRGQSTGTLVPKGMAANRSSRNFEGTSIKHKDLVGIPWRVAFALQSDGWWLRQDIIWHKPNPMPESVTDRCTKAHEYVFLLTKSARYFYDAQAVSEEATCDRMRAPALHPDIVSTNGKSGSARREIASTRNRRSVWTIPTKPFKGAHFAVMPPGLVEVCIKAGSKEGDMILDPFGGAGTTALVADQLGRSATICELNPDYAQIAAERIKKDAPMFTTVRMT